ncbi:MAG: hypothetical protein NDJ94_23145 [Vicinamibacteria bacterium]|nr:hypothetical protein [Vicinamibacteria bacterium]
MSIARNAEAYLEGHTPDGRYSSFDYCFNYFQSFRDEPWRLVAREQIQTSCLQLGFYLASWGMYRGSTDLLQRSARHLEAVIREIAGAPGPMWRMDVDQYAEGTPMIIDTARRFRKALAGDASDTLVTKILLGTFGAVPAIDTYFKRGFQVWTFGPRTLSTIAEFYRAHSSEVDRWRVPTLAFESGRPTRLRYTRAKVIDMVFFVEGSRA